MMDRDSQYHYSTLPCSAPAALPGHTITVTLSDMGMTSMMSGTAPMGAHTNLQVAPSAVNAGQINLVAANKGWRVHELVILPLADGAVVGQRVPGSDGKVAEAASLGEGINAGTVGWTSVTLPPGRYELVCNLANHYEDGMRQELDVT